MYGFKLETSIDVKSLASILSREIGLYDAQYQGSLPGLGITAMTARSIDGVKAPLSEKELKRSANSGAREPQKVL